MCITQSAISQRIRSLETAVGSPLIIRSPVIKATKAGEQLIAHYQNVLMLDQRLRQRLSCQKQAEEYFSVSFAVNTESLATWLVQTIAPVLKQNHMLMELVIEDQDRTINYLSEGRVWGCVTSVKKPPFGCVSHSLGKMPYYLVCAPEYKEKHFKQKVMAASLLKAPAAIWGQNDYMQRNFLTTHFPAYKNGTPTTHYVPSPHALLEFALRGIAFALLPVYLVKKHIKNHSLVNLLPKTTYELPLYLQTQELQTAATQELGEQIVKYARTIWS